MEGLIPLLYKAIKDRRSNAASGGGGGGRAYGTGGALPSSAPVDLDYPEHEQRRRWLQQQEPRSPVHAATASASALEGSLLHRRTLSLEELAGEVGHSPDDRRLRVPLPKARSVRAFACIGAA